MEKELNKEINICVFGASTTWGACDEEKGGWTNRLKIYLAQISDYNMSVYNLGISGDTSAGILKRFNIEAKSRQPLLIIFSVSDNDSVYIKSENRQMVSFEQFEKNLEELIEKSKKFTNKIIFLGGKKVDESQTTPIPWMKDYYYKNENIVLYDNKVKEIAEKNNLHYIYMFDLLNSEDLDDGLHPNSKGHQKIFEKVKDFLIKNKLIKV